MSENGDIWQSVLVASALIVVYAVVSGYLDGRGVAGVFRRAPYIVGIGIFVALVLAIVKYVYEGGQMWGWW